MAQPALSQQLLVLERELGARLLDRTPQGVAATPAGEALAARARAILRELGGLRDELHRAAGAFSGQLGVGLPPSLSQTLAAPLIRQVLERYPGIQLHVVEASTPRLAEALLRGELDCVLLASRPADDRVASLGSVTEPLVVAAAPASPAAHVASLEALAQEDWILPRPPNAMRNLATSLFAQRGLEPRVVAEVDSVPGLVSAVAEGLGVSLLPLAAAARPLAAGQLVTVSGVGPLERTLHLCARQAAEAGAAAAVGRLILGIMADEAAGSEASTGRDDE